MRRADADCESPVLLPIYRSRTIVWTSPWIFPSSHSDPLGGSFDASNVM
jgi:hypothetical protein